MGQLDPVSMRQVAEAAGVSVSAVSLALRNSPKVSQARRDEIVRIAERLGYRPDPRITELMEHLRTTRMQRNPARIALVVPELDRAHLEHYPPILGLMEGVQNVADHAGYGLDLFLLAEERLTPLRLRQIVIARGIKGVILAPYASGVAQFPLDCTDLCVATAGYSIVEPRVHRACPNYLQMMDELLAACTGHGYRKVGLVMTYSEGGIGHKLFTSSLLYYQASIPREQRIPVLPRTEINPENLRTWYDQHRPEVIISAGSVYPMLRKIGLRVPTDVAFASIDISEPPRDAAGANHRYRLVGGETVKLVLTSLNLNLTGIPTDPKVVLVDSHWRDGFSLPVRSDRPGRARSSKRKAARAAPAFKGFLD